ncbi:MAG: hypothetical protein ACE5JL_19970, partial [Dehalococcoidia bacterium]
MDFPCPLCGSRREVKETKKGKPYLVCDHCGVQLFVRYKEGIVRLRERVERPTPAAPTPARPRFARRAERLKKKPTKVSKAKERPQPPATPEQVRCVVCSQEFKASLQDPAKVRCPNCGTTGGALPTQLIDARTTPKGRNKPVPKPKEDKMARRRATFSGVYYCPECGTQEELINEDNICCTKCGELMTKGELP